MVDDAWVQTKRWWRIASPDWRKTRRRRMRNSNLSSFFLVHFLPVLIHRIQSASLGHLGSDGARSDRSLGGPGIQLNLTNLSNLNAASGKRKGNSGLCLHVCVI